MRWSALMQLLSFSRTTSACSSFLFFLCRTAFTFVCGSAGVHAARRRGSGGDPRGDRSGICVWHTQHLFSLPALLSPRRVPPPCGRYIAAGSWLRLLPSREGPPHMQGAGSRLALTIAAWAHVSAPQLGLIVWPQIRADRRISRTRGLHRPSSVL
jgi:hypothetical protein